MKKKLFFLYQGMKYWLLIFVRLENNIVLDSGLPKIRHLPLKRDLMLASKRVSPLKSILLFAAKKAERLFRLVKYVILG